MTLIVLALIATNIIAVVASGGVIRSLTRSHARERDLLVNQVMHLAGKSWTPPPAEQWTAPERGEPLVMSPSWTATPEQSPII